MPKISAKPIRDPHGEHILYTMLAASLTLVATIAAAALLPEAIGVTVAFVTLLAILATIGVYLRGLLDDPDAETAAGHAAIAHGSRPRLRP